MSVRAPPWVVAFGAVWLGCAPKLDLGDLVEGGAPDATSAPTCMAGLQAGAFWPMDGYCASRRSRTTVTSTWRPGQVIPQVPTPPGLIGPGPTVADVTTRPVIGADGTVYQGGSPLVAFGPDYAVKWALPSVSEGGVSFATSPVLAADGSIILIGGDSNFPGGGGTGVEVIAATPGGTIAWTYAEPWGGTLTSLAIGPDGTLYASVSSAVSGCGLEAIRPGGQQLWFAPLSTTSRWPSAASIGDKGTVYVASGDGVLHAISAAGKELWHFGLDATDAAASSLGACAASVGDDGTIYWSTDAAPGGGGALFALRPDGTVKWRNTDYPLSPVAIGADGTTYGVPSSNQAGVLALRSDGTRKWLYVPPPLPVVDGGSGFIYGDGPVLGGDGTIYQGTGNGLYAIRPDGTLAWHDPSLGACSSPAIGAGGSLYFITDQGPAIR